MLTAWQVAEVRRLLLEGRRQREICRLTRISRSTIARIVDHRRPDYEAIRQAKREEEWVRPTGPMIRCPGCGHLVRFPCRVCRARRWRFLSLVYDRSGLLPELEEPLGLELKPVHQKRYEEVRARRAILSRQANSRGRRYRTGDDTA